jgi:hypothetical protein
MKNNIPKKPRLVHGVGINDADYTVTSRVGGKVVFCPFYRAWRDMVARCYSVKLQQKNPTYIGCSVADEWLVFSSFKSWMVEQDWEGKALDKDILIQNNKVYSSSRCIFVIEKINNLLNNHASGRGKYPVGVSSPSRKGAVKYSAWCSVNGKGVQIGVYETPDKAHQAYKSFKYSVIAEVANQQSEPLRTALLNYVIEG